MRSILGRNPLHPYRFWYLVIIVSLGLFLTKALVIDRTNNPFKTVRYMDGTLAGFRKYRITADFSGEIRLLGVSLPESVKSGETAQIRLFWSLADATFWTRIIPQLCIYAIHSKVSSLRSGSFYPGNLATTNWLPGYYVEEVLDFGVPPFTPPGDYTLDVGLFDPETRQHLDVVNESGNPVDVQVVLDTIAVIRSDAQPNNLPEPIASSDGLLLLEISGIPTQAQVGDEIQVAWLWQMVEKPDTNKEARLVWLNKQNELQAATPFVPLTLNYPTSEWQVDDSWRGVHRLYVPGNLFSGDYVVAVEMDDTPIAVGEMAVTTPSQQRYLPPDVEHHFSVLWGNRIALLAYDDTATSVTLYWETVTQINESLRLFVQVVDDDDTILALTDSIPVDWTRPTTSWAIGEVITTYHDFGELPSGTYRVRVGWYDPITGERIALDSGEDAAFLPMPLVVD